MATIKIRDKEYPLPANFTFREANKIKRETGLLVGQIGDAFKSGDSDAVLALVIVALDRADDISVDKENLRLDQVTVDFSDDEPEPTQGDEQSPPAQAAAPDDVTGSAV